MSTTHRLDGATVLLLGQEGFAGDYLAAVLADCGARPVREAACPQGFAAALPTLRAPAVAVLRVAGGDEGAWSVADRLLAEGIPMLLTARCAAPDVPPHLRSVPLLVAPFAAFQVADALVVLLAGACTGPGAAGLAE